MLGSAHTWPVLKAMTLGLGTQPPVPFGRGMWSWETSCADEALYVHACTGAPRLSESITYELVNEIENGG